jgi:hypothetical protein
MGGDPRMALDSIVNFKDKHLTISTVEEPCYNTDCGASYFDVERYASPQGLMKIVQYQVGCNRLHAWS